MILEVISLEDVCALAGRGTQVLRRRRLFTGICAVSLASVSLHILSGVMGYRVAGICYGICDQEREKEFESRFDNWLVSYLECSSDDDESDLISYLDPYLAEQILTRNQKFSLLAQREADGTLTVGEREDYLADRWRVPEPRRTTSLLALTVIDESLVDAEQKSSDALLVRRCSSTGFLLNHGKVSSYCEGYVHIDFSAFFGFTQWSHLRNRVYRNLVETGAIEALIKSMREVGWRDYDLMEAAADSVAKQPAAQVSSDEIVQQTQREYRARKCEANGNWKNVYQTPNPKHVP